MLCAAASTRAQQARLATTPGDGSVAVDVDAYGAFGYRSFGLGSGGVGDAMYDPVGAVGPSSTSWQSAVFMRLPPTSTFLTIGSVGQAAPTGGLPDPGFTFQDGTIATSAFTHAGLDWELTQSVQDLVVGGSRAGSMLVQEYVIRNPGPAALSFDLVRYYEGDLYLGLGAGVPDGGGRLVVGSEELLFQTDQAGEPATTTNLIGITACGGVEPARGRYEVNAWPAFPNRISADMPLGDVVYNDGIDPDEFVDAGLDYDVGIALDNEFTIAVGGAALYVTTTVFGSLPPAGVSTGCAIRGTALADGGADLQACPGEPVTLDGSASFDGDSASGGFPLTWEWDLDVAMDSSGNGVPDDDVDGTGATLTVTFPVGTTVVRLTFTDDDGDVDTDLVTIVVEDTTPPVITCPAGIDVPAVSYAGGPASLSASATDDCDAAPVLVNDRTTGGADASDDYPCGATLVTFTATDASGSTATCQTTVRVVPPLVDRPVGPALRVTKRADGRPVLDWSLTGASPPELRFTVLRGEARRPPIDIPPSANATTATTWTDTDGTGPVEFYDVRTALCDGTLSRD